MHQNDCNDIEKSLQPSIAFRFQRYKFKCLYKLTEILYTLIKNNKYVCFNNIENSEKGIRSKYTVRQFRYVSLI